MDLDAAYPTINDLKARAKQRLPHFAWEYLDSATGSEQVPHRNRTALDKVLFRPAILRGPITPDLETRFLGQNYALPFGIAPIGMSGLIWPGSEAILAHAANQARIPYGLSTVATRLPEEIGPLAGRFGWFQLYPAKDRAVRRDICDRARRAGFRTLVVTVDVPAPSRRERQLRAGLTIPPRVTPAKLWDIAKHPAWALGTLRMGTPRLRLAESYLNDRRSKESTAHAGYLIRGAPDWTDLEQLRAEWHGNLIVKGVMDPSDAAALMQAGVDALWVSNHSGRQFDGAVAAIDVLPRVRAAVPNAPLIFDSGINSGLDILRALALGANFVMLGRAFHFAVAALEAKGPAHLIRLLRDDMVSNMSQIGANSLSALQDQLAIQSYTSAKPASLA